MIKRDYYETPSSSRVMRALWKAAGGDRYILERATYSDQIKYMCLGGIVAATGVMAGLAGGYAFYTIFSPKSLNDLNAVDIPNDPTTVLLSIIFGIIWGLIIYNIDRFIVTSTGKGDGTEKITWDEFKSAIPRIIMGAIIAITISKPVELRMFKTEIDKAVIKEQERIYEADIDQALKNFQKKASENKNKSRADYKRLAELDSLINYLTIQFNEEVRGLNGSEPGYQTRAKAIEKEKDKLLQERSDIYNKNEYKINLAEQNRLYQEYINQCDKAQKDKVKFNGLLIRIKMADQVTRCEGDSVNWISLFVTLLFLTIELTPIFFKLMIVKTPYDYLTENRDDLIRAENGIEVKYEYYTDKKGIEKHLVINHEAEKLVFERSKLAEIQRDLTEYALQKYKEREQKKIDENLDNFIFTDYKYGDTLNDKGEQGNDPLNSNA